MDTKNISEQLQYLGLNTLEAEILSRLVYQGETNITDLSKETKIPRGSIYRVLDTLESKGLINRKLGVKGNIISFTNLEPIKHLTDLERKELDKRDKSVNELSLIINQLNKEINKKPYIKYYEGKEGVKQIIWNTLKARSIIKVFTNSFRKELVGEEWLTNYLIEFKNRNLSDLVLGDKKYAENFFKKYKSRKEYFSPVVEFSKTSRERIVDSDVLSIQGEMYIYDDVLAWYSWENNVWVGTEIRSEYLAKTQSSIFDLLWSQTTEHDSIDNYQKI